MHVKGFLKQFAILSVLLVSMGCRVSELGAESKSEQLQSANAKVLRIESDNMIEALNAAHRLVSDHHVEPQNVLIVYDIDSTLLWPNQEFGSDEWFGWQYGMLGTSDVNSVAKDKPELIRINDVIQKYSRFQPVQGDAPTILAALQNEGFPSIALTSRDEGVHVATADALDANGINFRAHSLRVKHPQSGTYLPYNLHSLGDSGLSSSDVATLGLKEPRLVSYHDGLMMVDGQNKGAMLRTLLFDSLQDQDIRAVVFVDDTMRNLDAVTTAFSGLPLEVVAIHYTRATKRAADFEKRPHDDVIRAWQLMGPIWRKLELLPSGQIPVEDRASLQEIFPYCPSPEYQTIACSA